MVRAVEAGGLGAGAAASAFGFARQCYYNARKALAERRPGRPGPGQAGPQGRAQADREVMDFLEQPAGRRSRAGLGAAGRGGRGTISASACTRARSSGRCRPARRRRGQAAGGGAQKPLALTTVPQPAGRGPRLRPALRAAARHRRRRARRRLAVRPAVLAASGMAAWMAAAATWARPAPARRPAATARQRKRRPNGPCPPSTPSLPAIRRKEVSPPARPARRCRPPSTSRSSR